MPTLTVQEQKVKALLEAGVTRREIAVALRLSTQRVGQLVQQLVAKGVRVEAQKGGTNGRAPKRERTTR